MRNLQYYCKLVKNHIQVVTLVTPWKGHFNLPVALPLLDCQNCKAKTIRDCYTIYSIVSTKPDSGPLVLRKTKMTQGDIEWEEQTWPNPHQITHIHKIKPWSLSCKTSVQFLSTAAVFCPSAVTLLLLSNAIQTSKREPKPFGVEETEVYCSSADTYLPLILWHPLTSGKSTIINILQTFSYKF